jgi:catecholate siderophore receptor
LDPDTNQTFSGIPRISSSVNVLASSYGAYAIDTLRLGEKWQLIGGVRVDRFGADYKQTVAPALAFDRADVMTSWRGVVVYKPVATGSLYFDYGTSFNPSAESLSLSAANADTPPEKNRSYEIGTKWDLYSRKMSLRAALFRTDKTNAREPDPNNPTLNVLAGSQRVDGFQLEASGRLTDRWQLLSSYAFMNSKVVSSKFFPEANDAQLANVPRNTFSLWSSYQMPRRLDVGGGTDFVDSRTASSTSPTDPVTGLVKRVPGYWNVNAMARYPLTERVGLQVNVYNLTNKYYYDQLHPRHIVPGPGRSALIGLNFKF